MKRVLRLCCAIFVLTAVSACHRLSSTEAKVVGTWLTHSIDSETLYEFRPNHKYSAYLRYEGHGKLEWLPVDDGTWRIEQGDLVTDGERIDHWQVRSFGRDVIEVADGWNFTRVSSKPKT